MYTFLYCNVNRKYEFVDIYYSFTNIKQCDVLYYINS